MKERNFQIILFLILIAISIVSFRFCFAEEFVPNGKKDQSLTVKYKRVDMRLDKSWQVYSPVACSYRLMSTTTKAGVSHVIPAQTWHGRGVNLKTPYISYTGCANGSLQRQ